MSKENLFSPAHKSTNKIFRENYDKIFNKNESEEDKNKFEKFKKHLEEASEKVKTFPEWKKNILGKVNK